MSDKPETTILKTKRHRSLAVWVPVSAFYEAVLFITLPWEYAIACNATILLVFGVLVLFFYLTRWIETGEDV